MELTWSVQANFWTGPWPYWDLKERAPQLWSDLTESSLVIFKVRVSPHLVPFIQYARHEHDPSRAILSEQNVLMSTSLLV